MLRECTQTELVDALEKLQRVADYHRKQAEHARAVLVHVMFDIEEWRTGAPEAWAGPTLYSIEERVKTFLNEGPSEPEGDPHG